MSAPMPALVPEERSSKPITGTFQIALALLLIVVSFFIFYGVTTPAFSGDTIRYAGDAVQHAHGEPSQFWVFGHLLWRPWGYLGLRWIGPSFERYFGDTEAQAIMRFLIVTNFLCSLVTVILIWKLLRLRVSIVLATFVTIAFFGANCFLGYIKLGSAYPPGLCFAVLSLWLLVKASERTNRALPLAVAAGLSYAISVLLWVAYGFVLLGILLLLILWPLREAFPTALVGWRSRLPAAAAFLIAFGLATLIGVGVGATAEGAHSPAGALHWIAESGNGWSQNLNVVRSATGIPRALYELSSDTVLLKRWFLHDPYNPVHLSQLFGALLLKLLLFYVGMAALVWILWRNRIGRPTLIVLLGAALPLLFFGLFLFEPGSPDRYFPALPFIYLAAAVALSLKRWNRVASLLLIVLLFSSVLMNVAALAWSNTARADRVRRQRQLLNAQIAGRAVVFLPTLHDEFYYVPTTRPLDHSLASSKYDKYEVVDIVEPASSRVPHWRAEFSSRTFEAWSQGREVWVSRHAFAQRPERSWPWVEGDDPRLHWADLPQFFQQLAVDRSTGTELGSFVRIAKNPSNRASLSSAR